MIELMLREENTFALNEKTYPNCHLHRSSVNDVARTEHLTFICSPDKDDAGPTNNWMDPGAAKHKVGALFDGAMRGRTMYVVPRSEERRVGKECRCRVREDHEKKI